MQQQQRRSLAPVHRDDARATGLDLGAGEAFEHRLTLHRDRPQCLGRQDDEFRVAAGFPTEALVGND